MVCGLFFFQAEDGIRYLVRSRGLGDVYKRQTMISDLKDDKRKFAGKKDVPDYQFILTNKRKADEFRDRFGL